MARAGDDVGHDLWRGRRVLVTGHTGFKGSWLTLWLHRLGADILGYSLGVPTVPSLHEAAGLARMVGSEEGDVADLGRLSAAMARHRPEVVFHLAAQSLVRRSYDDPLGTLRANVMGTANLLEAARRTGGVRVVVNVTSDKCYRNNERQQSFRESDALGGSDPYSASKACAELVAAAYRQSFFGNGAADGRGPAIASVRAGNVIGGGDWAPDRIVPDAVRAVRNDEVLLVRHPRAVRPWQHVLDCLDGYLLLAERMWSDPALGSAWNFGPDESSIRSVAWMVDRIMALLGAGQPAWRHQSPGDHRHEATTLRLDSSRARTKLGWRPLLSIDEATQLTADWYRSFHEDGDALAVTLRQLADRPARRVRAIR